MIVYFLDSVTQIFVGALKRRADFLAFIACLERKCVSPSQTDRTTGRQSYAGRWKAVHR